ncbi:uncharacterized protein ACLA_013290 [Aspergillus clavatus NRRL 1]|uniref:Uncharacterized protein n=1 Tax=Aspergillus clavatus (strain ATCC 1007 / CBS 513.65 / DSM 816 / NCTC 3887 / NRRL 1 / QM 1276 / 107) TaxID=344612 RepID=A1CAX6_ASPCL|nr:uncharacterized protein ACLA_013290 [Aspergillus clavatus NRRL 1]EAW12894.1 conserved hypothetical protein [Aspergillus clavatus NRRL 1]
MTRLSTLSLALSALAWTPLSTAWTLTWRNSTKGATVVHETGSQNCTQIWHQKGQQFSWDPEGEWCLHFYKDVACTTVGGWSCDGRIWRKDASRDLPAYDVYAMPPDSVSVNFPSTSTTSSSTTSSAVTTTTTTSSSSRTTTTTPASTTATATPISPATTETPKSTNTALSGGAIAGIVVGAVAAIAILAALFFCLGRRNRRAKRADDPAPASASASAPATTQLLLPGSPLGLGSAPAYTYPADKMELAETEIPHAHGRRPYPGSRFVELAGDGPGAELSNSRQVQELDGSSDIKRPLY